jgi:hypothetical protein
LVALIAAVAIGNTAIAHEPSALEHNEFDSGWTATERRAGQQFTLTLPRVRALVAIVRELNALSTLHPETCQWMNQITGPETLARQVRAFHDYTRVRQAIETHLPVQDYLLTLNALNKISMFVHANDGSLTAPAATSTANIDFYRMNRTEIETLLDTPDPC